MDHQPAPLTASPFFDQAQNLFSGPSNNPVVFINTLLNEAVKNQVSDILLEPAVDQVLIRFRLDGLLYPITSLPLETYPQITSRLKVLAKLDTTEHRKTQEGQFSYQLTNKMVNVRVEIVQTIHGEMIVMRVLHLSSVVMSLNQLGFTADALATYQHIIASQSGLILVCGPTGSGKTTTLYSTINFLNQDKKFNVMTVEDPVEYQLTGVNQMPVREEDGFTFAAGLKSILRLSPDIILVGEIRDRDTALIAVESGLTGHMVLSTVHAPDVVGVLFRLLDFNIELFLINSAVRGIVSQRLVRRVCEHCAAPYHPEAIELEFFTKAIGRAPQQLVKGAGCPACQDLGYHGRIGIYEVLPWESTIRDLMRSTQNEDQIRRYLLKHQFKNLLIDGLLKAEAGFTTFAEVIRNNLKTV